MANCLESLITNQKRNFWDNSNSKVLLPYRAPGRKPEREAIVEPSASVTLSVFCPLCLFSSSSAVTIDLRRWCLIFQQSLYRHCVWCYGHWRNTCLGSWIFQSQSWSCTSVCFAEKETNYRQLQSKRGNTSKHNQSLRVHFLSTSIADREYSNIRHQKFVYRKELHDKRGRMPHSSQILTSTPEIYFMFKKNLLLAYMPYAIQMFNERSVTMSKYI